MRQRRRSGSRVRPPAAAAAPCGRGSTSASARASSSRSSVPTGPASRRWSTRCSGCCRSARARPRSSAGQPGAANSQIGYLPQRRSFDSGTRIRGVDLVRLGLDGTRWGFPLPAALSCLGAGGAPARRGGDRAGRRRCLRLAPDRRALRRRAAAAADRPGAGSPPADPPARRAARQPRPQQPGRGRGARAADLRDRGRDGAAGRPRRQPDPPLPRPGDLLRQRRRGRRDRRAR